MTATNQLLSRTRVVQLLKLGLETDLSGVGSKADHRPQKPLCLKVDASPDAGTRPEPAFTDVASRSSALPAQPNFSDGDCEKNSSTAKAVADPEAAFVPTPAEPGCASNIPVTDPTLQQVLVLDEPRASCDGNQHGQTHTGEVQESTQSVNLSDGPRAKDSCGLLQTPFDPPGLTAALWKLEHYWDHSGLETEVPEFK